MIKEINTNYRPTSVNKQTTECIYVCSPDWQHYLFTSLRSLLASGTSFDRITIFCIGKPPFYWRSEDPRVEIEELSPLSQDFFLANKTYLTKRDADRVIYLDADTLILKSIDTIWKNVDSDFIGRPASGYLDKNWNQQWWLEKLRTVNGTEIPYFNAGFVIFQNGSHRQLDPNWLDFTEKILAGELMKPSRFAEQFGLSLAISAAQLSYHLLDRTEHSYGWENESFEDAIVFHNGNLGYLDIATTIETKLGIPSLNLPVFRESNLFRNKILLHRKYRHKSKQIRDFVKAKLPWLTQLR